MRVLITGVTGMAGSHLAEYALDLDGVEVFGTYRWRSRSENLEDLRATGRLNIIGEASTITNAKMLEQIIEVEARSDALNLVQADMVDAFSMRHVIAAVRPDRIFHLAAQSYVPGSWSAPADTLSGNIIGELNLLEAVREVEIAPLIQIAGSSEEYGLVFPDELPIKETNPLRPLSPYAVSKVAQEMLALQYHRSYGLRTIVTRAFNHEGPRRGHLFVTSNMAKQVAEIEAGQRPPVIHVGDPDSKRDWTDVRDTVRAYWLALERGHPGDVYNIGCGVLRSVGEMLQLLLGMTERSIEVERDPTRLRPSDVRLLLCDASKFKILTGWEPQIPFAKTMLDLLNYWRAMVGQGEMSHVASD